MHTLEDVLEVLKPAAKYGMDGVERDVREELTAPRFSEAEPIRSFAPQTRERDESRSGDDVAYAATCKPLRP
jgi:hypothetical protein